METGQDLIFGSMDAAGIKAAKVCRELSHGFALPDYEKGMGWVVKMYDEDWKFTGFLRSGDKD